MTSGSDRPPPISDSPAEALELEAAGLDDEQRRKVLSSFRLTLTLTALIVLMILGLSAMIFTLVTDIFETLTPAVRHDLEWKAERGVAELKRSTELGIAAEDRATIARAVAHYRDDDDVRAIVVQDSEGRVLLLEGKLPLSMEKLTSMAPGRAQRGSGHFASWAPVEIEGVSIGRVALAVSTERLEAGIKLQRDILATSLGGALLALLAALAFVNLRIAPLLKITEQAFLQLERTTELALESARLKSQFLANMSHEIRTPMNGVLGMTRLILDMPLEPKLRRYVETVEASGRALLTIINDILDFSKVEAGKYKIQHVDYDLGMVTQEVAELLAERAHEKKLELICRVAPELPAQLVGDPDRYRQVLTNLVGNAIKFTEHGEVFIDVGHASRDGRDCLEIRVTDTGIGIAEDARDKIFEAFSQEDGSAARSYGGTGLGLAISKRMVEMMGGGIWVGENPSGHGSRFRFTLPLDASDQQPAPLSPIEPVGRRVVLVDENDHARAVVEEHLLAWGVRCSAFKSGREALEELERSHVEGEPFEVAVVASRTGDLTGAEVVAGIKESSTLSKTPVVVLNLLGTEAMPAELADVVVTSLTKPIRTSELYDCLVRLFSGDSPRRAKQSTSEQRPKAHPGSKVLVVDDNEINRFVAAEQVEHFGYSVELANDGSQAVEAMKNQRFAAVLMDCQMPVMDGYEATRRIREHEAESGRRTPIIALTAHALMGERDKVLEAGMDDYLTKPIRADALRKSLARLVQDAGAEPGDAPASADSGDRWRQVDESNLDPKVRRSPRVMELFLEHIPGQLAELRAAALTGDQEAIRANAHKLKGSCLSVGAWRMSPVAERLQHSDEAELSQARERVDELEELFEQLVREINPPRPSTRPGPPSPPPKPPGT